jgi:hypothetical protein
MTGQPQPISGAHIAIHRYSHGLVEMVVRAGDGAMMRINLTPDEAEALASVLIYQAHHNP